MRRRPLFKSLQFTGSYTVSGVTRDSTGATLAGCTISLFNANSSVLMATTVSDGAGAYSFAVGLNQPVFLVAYKAGAPDVAGTTINGVIPAPV